MSLKTKLHFARYEFKYVLSDERRKEFESELRFFVEFDPFVADRDDHKYPVRSLYYDDPFFTAFHNKHDGLHTRSKFRVRTYTYSSEENVPVFLELKGRRNNLVFKHRTPLNENTMQKIRSGSALEAASLLSGEQDTIIEQFHFETHRRQLRPVALVDYMRRPYISKYDPVFRVTFDDHLVSTQTRAAFPGALDRRRQMLPGPLTSRSPRPELSFPFPVGRGK